MSNPAPQPAQPLLFFRNHHGWVRPSKVCAVKIEAYLIAPRSASGSPRFPVNHWVRDHCMREDKTRSKNYNLNGALAGLRVCLITIKSLLYPDLSWPALQEQCQRDPSIAFRAIAKLRSK